MGCVPKFVLSAEASPDGWPEKGCHIWGQKAEWQSHIRVISVYASANPDAEPDTVRQLYKDLLNQMSFAHYKGIGGIISGGVEGCIARPSRAVPMTKETSFCLGYCAGGGGCSLLTGCATVGSIYSLTE